MSCLIEAFGIVILINNPVHIISTLTAQALGGVVNMDCHHGEIWCFEKKVNDILMEGEWVCLLLVCLLDFLTSSPFWHEDST